MTPATKHPGLECPCERFVTCKECIEAHRISHSTAPSVEQVLKAWETWLDWASSHVPKEDMVEARRIITELRSQRGRERL